MKYEVVLPVRPPGGVEVAARTMADAFGIPQPKAAALLRRAPGPLTKGIDEREAVRVAYRLRKLGLAVEVRPVDAQPAATAASRADRSSGGTHATGRDAGSAGDPAATAPGRRSPFLSQVDEAPPPIPGLDAVPPRAPTDRRRRDRREDTAYGGTAPASRPSAPSRAPGSGAPTSDAPRIEAQRAEAPPRTGHASSTRPEPDPEQIGEDAATTGGFAAVEAAGPTASGSWRVPEPYRSGERPAQAVDQGRGVRSPFGRRLLVAAVLPGVLALAAVAATELLVPEPSFALAIGVGILVLASAAGGLWLSGRSLVREHDRVLAETLRISRGDLARPVQASDRYPEAVQALERIRVSLQEGLDRLRRRKR